MEGWCSAFCLLCCCVPPAVQPKILLCIEGLVELAMKIWRSYYCVEVYKALLTNTPNPHSHHCSSHTQTTGLEERKGSEMSPS